MVRICLTPLWSRFNEFFRYLDEVEIKESRAEYTRIESDDGVKLVIKEVSSELSGQYTCKLSNECGTAETSAKLTVNCTFSAVFLIYAT